MKKSQVKAGSVAGPLEHSNQISGEQKPRALAISTTGIGDLLLNTPALEALGRNFTLELIAHQHRAPLMASNPFVERVHPYRNNDVVRFWLGLKLWPRRYRAVVVLHANDDAVKLLGYLRFEKAFAMQDWGARVEGLQIVPRDEKTHWTRQRLALAHAAGGGGQAEMRVFLLPSEQEAGLAWLQAHGVSAWPRVAMCPGAADHYKCWPTERFGLAARKVLDSGGSVLLVGSPNEADLMARVQEAAGTALPLSLGSGLRDLAARIAGCDLMISNDTGPMHLAQAVGVATVGIFGGSQALVYGPIAPNSVLIQAPVDCEKCLVRCCSHPRCLDEVGVAEVMEASWRLLDQGRR